MGFVDKDKSVVYVVDDDRNVRNSILRLLKASGYRCRDFDSAVSYLAAASEPSEASCLVLDIRMPDVSGMELQKRLPGTDHDVPIIFVSAHGDIPTCVEALKAGAVNFLQKPFEETELLESIQEALRKSKALAIRRVRRREAQAKYDKLSPRERGVFALLIKGRMNKQVASDLGIAEKTVKIHRCRIMAKMDADSVADLMRMAGYCELL